MWTVVYEFQARKNRVLKLDHELPKYAYKNYVIDGKTYDIVPVYDAKNCIAVETSESLLGKEVKFI